MKGKTSLLVLVLSFILYMMDIISDVYVAFQYYNNGETWWCVITLVFVMIPHVIINTYAAYINLNFLWMSAGKSFVLWVLQLSIIASFKQEFARWKREYWNVTKDGQQFATDKTKKEQHSTDVTLTMHHTFLCLAEAFAESAPQCCLQNYIMIKQWRFPWYTVLSTFISLFSLAWSITSLETSCKTCQWTRNATAEDDKNKGTKSFPKLSLVIFLAAHLCLLVARVTSLVIFAYAFRYYVFIVVGFHWSLVFIAICMGKKFHQSTKIISITKNGNTITEITDRIGLTLILNASLRAYPMVFCLSSSIAKLSFRKKISENFKAFVIIFYSVQLVENTAMVLFAVCTKADHMHLLMMIALPLVFAGFTSGILFLLLYYTCYHPSKIVGITESSKAASAHDTCSLNESTEKEDNIEMQHVKYFVNARACYEDLEPDRNEKINNEDSISRDSV